MEYGIDEPTLRAHLRWQLTVVRFVSVRFGTGIQISQDKVKAYFEKQILPKLPAGAPHNIEEYRRQIEDALVQQRANEQADEWLRETRSRIAIDFHPEVFS